MAAIQEAEKSKQQSENQVCFLKFIYFSHPTQVLHKQYSNKADRQSFEINESNNVLLFMKHQLFYSFLLNISFYCYFFLKINKYVSKKFTFNLKKELEVKK